MLKDLQTILDKLIDNHRRHKAWQKVVMVLACITVFCTTYALILPAITMETSPDVICGLEEHTHTNDCYTRTPVLICGLAEGDEHKHTDECYQMESVLICGKTEHKHTDECFSKADETSDGEDAGEKAEEQPEGQSEEQAEAENPSEQAEETPLEEVPENNGSSVVVKTAANGSGPYTLTLEGYVTSRKVISANAVVKEILSDCFKLPDDVSGRIKLYTADCTGVDSNGNCTFGAKTELTDDSVSVTVSGKTIEVKNFNFSANWCGNRQNDDDTKNGDNTESGDNTEKNDDTENGDNTEKSDDTGTVRGKKLIIEIPVEREEKFLGGFDVPIGTSDSGIYSAGNRAARFEAPAVDVAVLSDEQLKDAFGKNKTIYCGSAISAEALYKAKAGDGFIMETGHNEYTFSVSSEISNLVSASYPVTVTITSKKDDTQSITADFEASVYVKVPTITWKDSSVPIGGTNDFTQNLVSVEWNPDGSWPETAPALKGEPPELIYTFVNRTSGKIIDNTTKINVDTPVDVTVSANNTDITSAVRFERDTGSAVMSGQSKTVKSVPSVKAFKSSVASPKFYLLAAPSGVVLPATGGGGIYSYIIVGLTLMTAPIMIGFIFKRRRHQMSAQ